MTTLPTETQYPRFRIRDAIRSHLPKGVFEISPDEIVDTRKTQQNALQYGSVIGVKIKTHKLANGGLRVWVKAGLLEIK